MIVSYLFLNIPPIYASKPNSQVLDEPLDARLERPLAALLDLRVANVAADSEAVRATGPVRAEVVLRLWLAAAEDVVADLLLLGRVLLVDLARVDEQRHARRLELLEVLGHLQQRRVGDDDDLELAVVHEVERVACAKAVACRAELRDSLLLESGDHLVERRACLVSSMGREPFHKVKLEYIRRFS